MSLLTIPAQWLIPQKLPNEWRFQCSTSLDNLVATNQAAPYFRQLVTLLESDHQLVDYQLKFQHDLKRNNQLDIFVYFGESTRISNPPPISVCISCEPTHELSSTSLLSEQQYTRTWLDFRARPKLILTPIRHIERLSELTDDNGEMEAFWKDTVELIDRESGQLEKSYLTMKLNHGTYRNHAHLHLKINFTDELWSEIIAPRHKERIEKIKRLLQEPAVVKECMGQRQFEKMERRRNQVKK
jgi:hypothetical protein